MADNDVKVKLSLDSQGMNGGISSAISSLTSLKGQLLTVAKVAAKAAKAFVKFGKDAVKWFGNVLKSAVKMGVGVATAFAGFASAAVKAAGDAQALDEMFSATFGDMADDATKAMKRISKETGIHAGRLKEPLTTAFMQIKGSGVDAAEAILQSERAIRLAADAAAANNISMEEAVKQVLSFIRGNTEAGDSIKVFTSETQRNEKAMKKYGKAYKDLTEAQKQMVMLDITEEIYRQSGAWGQAAREAEGLENIMGNLKYAIKDIFKVMGNKFLDSAIQEIKEFTGEIIDITNLLEKNKFGEAFDLMTTYVSNKVSEFAKNIPQLMTQAINGIGNAIQTSLPKMLKAGGDLIQNICKGIVDNQESISNAISDLLGQIATWITQNMPAIEQAGKAIIDAVGQAIENNKEEIRGAVKSFTETAVNLFIEYKSLMVKAGLEFGVEFVKGIWKGIWEAGQNYKPTNDNYFVPTPEEATQEGLEYGTAWISSAGKVFDEKGPSLKDSLFSGDTYTKIQVSGEESGYAYINGIKTKISDLSPEVKAVVDDLLKNQEGATESGKKTGKAHTDGTKSGIQEGKEGVKGASKEVATESTAAMLEELSNLSPETYQKMLDAAQAVRQSATDMYNGAKYSFSQLGKAAKESMTDMYKGVKTSMYKLAQAVKQEASNMYNGAKTSFINLCNVGKNQFSNLYNGAGNSIRQLSHTVQGCMNTIKSSINSIGSAVNSAIADYNRLRSALSKPINASVNIKQTKTISTINAEPQAAMAMATSTLAMPKSPISLGSGPLSKGQGGVIENNIYLDGKLIAKSTAPYSDKEITKINNRMNRLGGRI